MIVKRWWNSLSFYWQIYLLIVVFLGVIITAVEVVAEPYVIKWMLAPEVYASYRLSGEVDFSNLEAVLWLVGVMVPSLLVGFFAVGLVRRKLDSVVRATRRLADGDLSTRVPDLGSGRDVFSNLALHFNRMADSIQILSRNEKRLMADISHELRSPLTRMGVAVSVLENSRDAEDYSSILHMLENDIEHMNNLVEVLLIQGRNRVVNPEDRSLVDVSELLADLAEKFTILGRDENKTFSLTGEPGVLVSGFDTKLRMVFENILSNALFYTPAGSEVVITARTLSEQTVISIRDQGPGVPEEDLQNIFQHFFRTDASRTRNSGGVGLGLAIVNESVHEMGGTVKAANSQPGLEVTIVFPKGMRPE